MVFLFSVFLLNSCATSYTATSWKAQNLVSGPYSKIMVIGVIKSSDTTLRRKMEVNFVNDLRKLGYNAVSALEEYGPKGLSNLAQEATYVKLCSRGIDAIITIALLDKTKGDQEMNSGAKYYSDLYFYNHILNYKKMQADVTDTTGDHRTEKQLFLESILFDLQTLQPIYVFETKPFDETSFNSIQFNYGKVVIKDMLTRKILTRQLNSELHPIKAF